MASDTVVVEAKCNIALTNNRGRRIYRIGVFAVEHDRIERYTRALPARLLAVLDRPPTEEEIRVSTQAGLLGATAPAGDPGAGTGTDDVDMPLTELTYADLQAGARLLGLSAGGKRDDLLTRILAEAQRLQVSTEGPGLEALTRIHTAQGEATGGAEDA